MTQSDFCQLDLDNDKEVSNLLSFQDNCSIQNVVNIMREGEGGGGR